MRFALGSLLTVCLIVLSPTKAQPDNLSPDHKVLISVGNDTVSKIFFTFKNDVIFVKKSDKTTLLRISSKDLPHLTKLMHQEFGRCVGYMVENESVNPDQILETVDDKFQSSFEAPPIRHNNLVNRTIGMVEERNIQANIETLSNFRNRLYKSSSGVQSQQWVGSKWKDLVKNLRDTELQYFEHSAFPQRSVILTLKGSKRPNEIVIVGGHGDSIAGWNANENTRAPGADDNASGISTITEVIRILGEIGYRPDRTIKFMSYAAEEVGLLGSQDIATDFKQRGEHVIGVLQFDMTNYTKRNREIALMTDYTDRFQNEFIKNIIKTYLPHMVTVEDRCGYACSDHASWNRNGFPASIPFESRMSEHNHAIHSTRDTLAMSENRAFHASQFSKIALGYLIELAALD